MLDRRWLFMLELDRLGDQGGQVTVSSERGELLGDMQRAGRTLAGISLQELFHEIRKFRGCIGAHRIQSRGTR